MTKTFLSNVELYEIWCKHVPAGAPIDMMDVAQFFDAARDIMRAMEDDAVTTAEEVIK